MRWGRILVAALAGLVGLAVWLGAVERWDGPTSVQALELDETWRQDDAGGAGQPNVDDDDGDGAGNGARAGGGATDDARDGTWDGDTRDGRGTGTGISGAGDGIDSFQDGGGGGTTAGDGGT